MFRRKFTNYLVQYLKIGENKIKFNIRTTQIVAKYMESYHKVVTI